MQLLDNMQSYACLLISSKNISEAQLVLKQALVCINDIFESDNPPPIWRKKLLEAKISTILAKCCREIGLHGESIIHLRTALEKYGLKLKKNKIRQTIKFTTSKVDEMLTFYLFPEIHTKTLSRSICEYNNDIADALNMFAQALMVAKKWKEAQAVALQALYRALNAQTDFARICDCFSTILSILILRRKRHLCIALEVYALKFCYRKRNRVESDELSAVCRLYMRVFSGKLNRAELDYCIHMGYIIIRLSASLNDTQALLYISVNLINVLMAKLYVQEAASLLLELEFCTDSVDDTTGLIWFHCQALLFHIEVGYCIIPYEQCVNFLQIRSMENIDLQHDEATERLTILMWLWCLRNEQYERALRFEEYIKNRLNNLSDMTSSTVFSVLLVLQGLLLLTVHKMNRSSIKEVRKLDAVINTIMKCVHYETSFIRVLRSRLYTMKAFYYHIKNQEKKAHKWLDRSSAVAKKQGMALVVEWNDHNRKAWKNELPKKKMDFWKDHCEENNLIFYQEYDMNTDDIGFFTLPTPLYV